MKRFLLFLILSFIAGQLIFAGDLFFSEYIEGSSYNKAIEIYNATGAVIDLSHYVVKQANGGSGWGYYTPTGGTATEDTRYVLPLSGTLNAGDVYVIYNTSAVAAITSVGDLGFAYNSTANGGNGDNVPSFNGNDALGLFKDDVLIDVIGIPSEDPGDGWVVAGTSTATKDHTIIRKSSITQGNTNWTVSAGTSGSDSEWLVMEQNYFSNLGFHDAGSSENIPPIADAGNDQIVGYDSEVTLDGSGSFDPGGNIISYLWSQITGTSVPLTNADQVIATFTAPAADATLEFTLTVTDDSSTTDIDTVMITVVDGSPSQVIISEYVEGSSYNKYLEIFNGSESAIDLNEEGYSLRLSSNGNNDFWATLDNWGSLSLLQPQEVIVLGHVSAALAVTPDTLLSSSSPINFNGNDAIGLFKNGLLIDIIGEPENSSDIIKDHTYRRKNTVSVGNPVFDLSEWEEYPMDNIDNLGIHSSNPYAPAISNVTLADNFITSAEEIELTAEIIPAEGKEISVALIKYGTGGSFPNESVMWQDNGNIWMGIIPAQAAYTELDYKIVATDNEGNAGESSAASVLIADASTTNIADIRANKESYIGNMATVQGIITIGTDVIDSRMTKAYLQDASGKGINLFNYSLIPNINRGDELRLVGTVIEYNSVLELTDFNFEKVSEGNDLPEAQTISISEANSLEYEGTLVKFNGIVSDTSVAGGGVSVYVNLGNDSTTVRIWESTGIDLSNVNIGSSYWFQGVINPYYDDFQLLVGYQEDIWGATGVDEHDNIAMKFELQPAYPNPFNPTTTITWHLDRAGDYELAAYNIVGQKVDVISKHLGTTGAYSINWNAGHLPSGVYFIQLDAQNRHLTQKVLLIK